MKAVTRFESDDGEICHTAKDVAFCHALKFYGKAYLKYIRDFDEDDYAKLLSWTEEEREVLEQFLEATKDAD